MKYLCKLLHMSEVKFSMNHKLSLTSHNADNVTVVHFKENTFTSGHVVIPMLIPTLAAQQWPSFPSGSCSIRAIFHCILGHSSYMRTTSPAGIVSDVFLGAQYCSRSVVRNSDCHLLQNWLINCISAFWRLVNKVLFVRTDLRSMF